MVKGTKKANPVLDDEDVKPSKRGAKASADTSTTGTATDTADSTDTKESDAGSSVGETAVAPNTASVSGTPPPKALIERVRTPSDNRAKVEAPKNPDAGLLADARRMKAHLEKQDKYPIMIPLEPGEKVGPHCVKDVWINGFHMQVPKGVLVRVPEGVFEVLSNGMELLNNNAGSQMLLSRDEKVEDALSR